MPSTVLRVKVDFRKANPLAEIGEEHYERDFPANDLSQLFLGIAAYDAINRFVQSFLLSKHPEIVGNHYGITADKIVTP